MATGLTGVPVHKGSWFGLPDFGITETLQGKLSTSPSPTGLSNPTTGAPVQSFGSLGATPTMNYQQALSTGGLQQISPAPGTGEVLGGQAPPVGGGGGGGGGDSKLDQYKKMAAEGALNAPQMDEYKRMLAEMQGSAQSQADAELQSALTEFDRSAEEMNAQRSRLGTERGTALSDLETAWGKSQKQAATSTTEAENATAKERSRALSTAQDTQRANRNILRALGILSSSAAGEMLTKPMNEYQQVAADMGEALVKRKDYIQNWLGDRMTEHQQAVRDINEQYAQLIDNIDRDMRFNDRQKVDAVRTAKAALSQRLSDIQASAVQYQQAAKQYNDSIAMQIAQLQLYQNPNADVSGILSSLIPTANNGFNGQTENSIFQRKKSLTG